MRIFCWRHQGFAAAARRAVVFLHMLRARYDLRPRDRSLINFLRSCDESSDDMSDKNTETASATTEAAPFTEQTRVATTPQTQPHGVPRPPSLSSEIGILEKASYIRAAQKEDATSSAY